MNAWSQWRTKQAIDNRLHVDVRGTGEETVVFVPGLGGTTRYWAARTAPLETHCRVVLVDLLGFGQSAKPWTRYSVDRHVTALWSALAPYAPFTLVGHSLGALLATALAARHRAAVQGLVLLSMPHFATEEDAVHYYRSGPMRGGYVATNLALTIATCLFTRWVLGRVLPYMARHVPREVAEDLVKHTWRSSTSSLWEVVYRYDATPDLGSVDTPVLFIHGDRDVMAPVHAVEPLAQEEQRQLKVLTGVDHHPFLRDPAQCLAFIEALLNEARDVAPRHDVDIGARLGKSLKEQHA